MLEPDDNWLESLAEQGNKVAAEWLRQASAGSGLIDLVPLWRVAGSPRAHSPRRLARSAAWDIDLQGSGPNGPAYVTPEDALLYASRVDKAIMRAVGAQMTKAIAGDPARAVMAQGGAPGETNPFARLAINAVLLDQGISPEDVIAEVKERTSHLDECAQETEVAKAQRLLGRSGKQP